MNISNNIIKILMDGNTIDDYIESLNNIGIDCTKRELDLFMRSTNLKSNSKFNKLLCNDYIEDMVKLINTKTKNINTEEKILKVDYYISLWKENKIIYELDIEFINALLETKIDKIPVHIFSYIPYKQSVIKIGQDVILLDIDKKFNFITINVITLIDMRNKSNIGFGLHSISFDSRKEYIIPTSITNKNTLDKLIYSFIMYISNPTPGDIEKDKNTIYNNHNSTNKKINQINKWNIGYRYGNAIRKLKKENKDTAKISINKYKKHSSPRPHIRKAHWHTYKVGKGRKNILVKWISPVLVNTNESNDLIPTIQKVKL